MAGAESVTDLLNSYRDEIRARSPRSFSIWCNNRTVMPAGVGSIFRLADPFPMVVKKAREPAPACGCSIARTGCTSRPITASSARPTPMKTSSN
jgi:hypothetical protein